MNFPKLSKRLLVAASFVREGDFVADVGTDHAYLPIYLYLNKKIRGAVVSDINEGPIARAERNIAEFSCMGSVIPLLSDGLCKIDEFSPDTVFILGMGGELIANIISKAEWVKEKKVRLVMQPMTHSEILRKYLFENGFEIIEETLVDDGKIYQIFSAEYTGVITEADALELCFGKINLFRGEPLLLRALEREKNILFSRVEGRRKAGLDGGEDGELLRKINEYTDKGEKYEGTRDL